MFFSVAAASRGSFPLIAHGLRHGVLLPPRSGATVPETLWEPWPGAFSDRRGFYDRTLLTMVSNGRGHRDVESLFLLPPQVG